MKLIDGGGELETGQCTYGNLIPFNAKNPISVNSMRVSCKKGDQHAGFNIDRRI